MQNFRNLFRGNKCKSFLIFSLISLFSVYPSLSSTIKEVLITNHLKNKKTRSENNNLKNNLLSQLKWNYIPDSLNKNKQIQWNKIQNQKNKLTFPKSEFTLKNNSLKYINSFNRSIVFDNERIGPDIGWIVPPGFKWNKKYKLDFSARGHNTKIPEPLDRNFFAWNDGDAVGLISYQFLHNKKSSFGFNLGIRSLYKGDGALGGESSIGEGISSGFRWDYEISRNSGLAFGAEQLIHFDSLTDTGRNFYITLSKGWWSTDYNGEETFPLYTATAGLGTGRMAVGTIRGLCSSSIANSGTEIPDVRNLCWSPVFSMASVWNEKISTFFEYNSRFFLLGTSIVPNQNIPLRGTFALILSDHVDNYKLHSPAEINWVFNISLGI